MSSEQMRRRGGGEGRAACLRVAAPGTPGSAAPFAGRCRAAGAPPAEPVDSCLC